MKKKTKKVLATTLAVAGAAAAAVAYQRSRDTFAKTRRGHVRGPPILIEDPLDDYPQTNGYITIRPENFDPKRKHAGADRPAKRLRPAKQLQPTRLPTPRDEFDWFDNYG